MNPAISEYCVYTIVHREKLEATPGPPTTFDERKAWVTAANLWRKAKAADEEMPVLLADATDCSCLLFWGLLTDVRVAAEGTSYSVDRLRKFKGKHRPQELTLRSTGKKIKPNYIRPYAICRTPDFLKD